MGARLVDKGIFFIPFKRRSGIIRSISVSVQSDRFYSKLLFVSGLFYGLLIFC